jgi:GT2 family glycosyltransferase
MGHNGPLVTIYSLCYNTGKYVVEGLESFKDCGISDYELIVVDDCSTDGSSVQIVEQWLEANEVGYRFIKHTANQGICKTLNEVLSIANGKYITGICDDSWEKDRLSEDVVFMEQHPDFGLVFCNARIMDKDSKVTGENYGDPLRLKGIDEKGNYLDELYKGNFIIPPACIFRTSVLKSLGGFDERLSFEDWDMYLRIAKNHIGIKYLDHTKVRYRIHSTSFWQSRSYSLLTSLVSFFEKHSILKMNDSLVSYLEHFRSISWRHKLKFLFSLLKQGKIRLFVVGLLTSIGAPMPIRYRVYRILFNPISHR